MTRTHRLLAACALLAAATGASAGPLSVTKEMTIDSAPATVWKLVGDFNALDIWHPAVAKSTASGSGVGAKRVLTLGNGATIDETQTARGKHSYSYKITKSPLPVKNYKSTIALKPAGEGKTLMTWSSTFEADGAPDDKATETIAGIYDAGLAKVAGNFKK